jgi:hypothetical protein
MIERGERVRLALESRKAIRVGCELLREDLERDRPPEPCVDCTIHFAHAAGAERRIDLVDAEAAAHE